VGYRHRTLVLSIVACAGSVAAGEPRFSRKVRPLSARKRHAVDPNSVP
jgi:hypothetical protein